MLYVGQIFVSRFRKQSSLLLSYKTWSRKPSSSESCGFLKKVYPQGRSQTSLYQSGMPSPALYLRIICVISAQSTVARLIHTMILYVGILNVWHHVSGKIASGVAVRGDSSVAGEQWVIGVRKFHSWGKCTIPLTNINSDWMSNASSGLCIILLSIYNMWVL